MIEKEKIEIIDTHIHLFPASELQTLAWCKPGNPLASQHSISEYRSACHPPPDFVNRGFVFLETDRISSLSDWEFPLKEVDWLNRIATGKPKEGEGHTENDKELVLGIVPWAPLPVGKEKLSEYVGKAREKAEKVKGFRYLVQNKAKGTMLGEGFIEGLKYLGREGYSFDLGVDFRQGGVWQLEDAVEMIRRAHGDVETKEKVVIVINHMCKPDMLSTSKENAEESFDRWKSLIYELGKFENTYMKVSGAFSEIEPFPSWEEHGSEDQTHRLKELVPHISRYIDVVWDAFGAQRCVWGSDWPVCNIGGGGNRFAWTNWLWIVRSWAAGRKLSESETRALFGANAAQVYKISEYGDGKSKDFWVESY